MDQIRVIVGRKTAPALGLVSQGGTEGHRVRLSKTRTYRTFILSIRPTRLVAALFLIATPFVRLGVRMRTSESGWPAPRRTSTTSLSPRSAIATSSCRQISQNKLTYSMASWLPLAARIAPSRYRERRISDQGVVRGVLRLLLPLPTLILTRSFIIRTCSLHPISGWSL